MNGLLNILVIEDDIDDFELLIRVIKKEGYEVKAKRIETKSELLKNLDSSWDIILCDNNLPAFNATSALDVLREFSSILPFIIVSGDISAEVAVKAMRAGANDYIMKSDTIRLVPAIEREIKDYKIKKEKGKIQRKLDKSLQKYELLVKNIQDLVCLMNTKGFYAWVSPSCEQILGFSQAEMKKLGPTGIIHSEDVDRVVREVFSPLREGKLTSSTRFTCKCIHKDGSYRDLETVAEPIYVSGVMTKLVTTSRDVTELVTYRENLEFMVIERTEKLNKALSKEKELVAMKSKFVSMASHEFRTPLSSISFASDYIKKYYNKIDHSAVEQKLIKIDKQVEHMVCLLDDVLLMGKTEAQTIKVNTTKIFLKEYIEELAEEVENSVGNSHDVMIRVDNDIMEVDLDQKLLRNILVNLLTNAIKYSPGERAVKLYVRNLNDALLFKVIDNGIGMEEENIDRIFDPFHRNENVDSIQGTGLGLSIVKRAIDIHGGVINVKSKIDVGTTFTFKIPINTEVEMVEVNSNMKINNQL